MTSTLRKTSARSKETVSGSNTDALKAPPLHRALSFVKKNMEGGGYNHWAGVPATESYALDCGTGVALAEEFISFIGRYHTYGNGSLLGSIMIDMENNGATRGHKIGFMNTINKYAMAGGYLSRMPKELTGGPAKKAERRAAPLVDEAMPTTILALYAEWEQAIHIANSEKDEGQEAQAIVARSAADHRPHPMIRLERLLVEATSILRDNSDMEIARIALNEHGIQTFNKVPGFEKQDPLRDTIHAYRDGVKKLGAMKEQITRDNEDSFVQQTYGPCMDALLTWDKPAGTREGAIEALKLMSEEQVFLDSMGEPLRLAVLRYLESLEGMVA
ncbi:hypothetical protein [Rhizobium leguminosarum]|uniref:hypothetical protein n=1 Tax=Rhizobium leguminosarum TaxID=384 RepID=UPI001C906565|nr:hypothetical protein [Rhizobium leguminosarum]MBY2932712.1 hypothetical protein [Rhizobium leguminosarum]